MRSIIQGGMGIFVSNPTLARTTAMAGALGTVSCTAADRILANLLQRGDPGGHCRRALEHFPFPEVAERVWKKWYVEGGIPPGKPLREVPIFSLNPKPNLIDLAVCGSFVLIWLSKEGHDNPISVNYLEKLQTNHLAHLTGAVLAEVDEVTMGAGITLQIPGVLNALAEGRDLSYRAYVEGSQDGDVQMSWSPRKHFGEKFPRELKRPGFLPIISTDALANIMMTKVENPHQNIQAFVIETPIAGGHNAPPRKKGLFNARGEPVYGPKDEVDWKRMREFGIPFYIGGGYASPEHLAEAQALGAEGVQCGTLFALANESGLSDLGRDAMRYAGFEGVLDIFTSPNGSPTGFPFKIPLIKGSISEEEVYNKRKRNCSRKALQFPAINSKTGKLTYRCAAEPVDDYVDKGGKIEDTVGARCLCNGLFAAANIGDDYEVPIFTLGDDYSFLPKLMKDEHGEPSPFGKYGAADAFNWLMSRAKAA